MIIQDKQSRENLSKAMPTKNANVVRQAPGVAVFLADTSFVVFLLLHRSNCYER